jgi:hypothetical protein
MTTDFDSEMMAALEADGEKLRAMTGEDHGPFDLDAPAMTKREALQIAHERLTSVVAFCLDLGLEPDRIDKDSIRNAHEMVSLALKR